jgi:hypothetical protein
MPSLACEYTVITAFFCVLRTERVRFYFHSLSASGAEDSGEDYMRQGIRKGAPCLMHASSEPPDV